MSKATTQTKDTAASKDQGFRFDFVKWAPTFGGVSVVLMILSVILVLTKGLNYGIDFAGGTEVQVRFENQVDQQALREAIEAAGAKNPAVQGFGGGKEFLIRLETPHGATEKETNDRINANVSRIREAMKTKFALKDDGLLRVDTVGPQIGSELKRNGFLAAFYSFLVILIYVSLRFDYKYAPGAVLCLVHDVTVTVGVFALLGREFNVQIMAAILTLIGYSLNDTIVTFDRIRETAPQNKDKPFSYVINLAINDMLGRTILTAGATFLAVMVLFFFGGGVIAEIAFTMMVGVIIGCYSSVYVAAPLILVMEKFKKMSGGAAA